MAFSGAQAESAQEGGTIEYKLVHHYTDPQALSEAKPFNEMLEMLKLEYPQVKLTVEAIDNETLKTKIKTLMAADEVPDLLRFHGTKFAEPFIKAGKHLPIGQVPG
jgi:raffinose/stachyose/melibiose transport system substrate-binding protein